MPLLILRFVLSAFFCVFLIGVTPVCGKQPAVGDKAPLITGKRAAGRGLLKLQSLIREVGYQKNRSGHFRKVNGRFVLEVRHNIVVLNFFSTACIPCLKEIPAYNRVADRFRDDLVKLIYVNVEANVTRRKIRRFIARKGIQVPMMLPNQRDVIKKYAVVSLPMIVIIDRRGKISHIMKGFTENLESVLVGKIRSLLPPD